MEFLKQNKTKILYIGGAILLLFITMGVTYAVFTYAGTGTKENTLSTGKISFEYNEASNGIELTDAMPMSDTSGKARLDNYFDFNVKAEIVGTTTISYTVYGVDISESTNKLYGQYVKVYLTDQSDSPKSGYIDTVPTFAELKGVKAPNNIKGKLLYQDQFSVSGTHDYRIRMWVDESYEITEVAKTFKMRVDVTTEAEEIPLAITTLLKDYANEESAEFDTENADNPVNHKMFVFHHEAGAQQEGWSKEELTDYRYIGADPNNYVTFNGEEAGWRIIGIFTVENEKGEKEKRIKIIKTKLTTGFVWDTGDVNDWTNASLMKAINPDTGETTYNLTDEGKQMIGDAKWYLGGAEEYKSASNGLASHFYGYERGTETCQTTGKCDTDRQTYWIGKVGLMYLSDIGYATSGGSTTNREACLAKAMYNWNLNEDCGRNGWLLPSSSIQWIMLPYLNDARSAFVISCTSVVCRFHTSVVSSTRAVRPVVYLLSDIQYLKGNGSQGDPFVFEI